MASCLGSWLAVGDFFRGVPFQQEERMRDEGVFFRERRVSRRGVTEERERDLRGGGGSHGRL